MDGRKDGRNGRTDGRTDDAKTISLRLRRGITKAVDHKPIDSKTCTEFENYYLTIGEILQIPLILTHAQTKSNYTLKKF